MEETKKTEGVQCDPKDAEENKGITILSYIGILFLVPLLTKKDSKFAQYHAKQGLVLFIVFLIGAVLMPVFGLGAIVYVVGIVLSIIGIINVVNGKCKEVPLVGQFASKFKF